MSVRSISWIFDEGERYGKVNVQGILYNLYDEEDIIKNGVQLKRKLGIFQDRTGIIKITIFSEEDLHLQEDVMYELTNFTMSCFNQRKRLNSNAASRIQKLEKLDDLEEILHNKVPDIGLTRITNASIMSIPNISDRKYKCSNCKNIFTICENVETVLCGYCNVCLSVKELRNIAYIKDIRFETQSRRVYVVSCRFDKMKSVFGSLREDDLGDLIEEEVDISFDRDDRRIVTICKSS